MRAQRMPIITKQIPRANSTLFSLELVIIINPLIIPLKGVYLGLKVILLLK